MGILRIGYLLLLLAVPAVASGGPIDPEAAFVRSQAAIGNQTGSHILTDHRGRALSLAELRGRPLVVSLVFTSCSTVCPVTTEHLRDAVLAARRTFGDDAFDVLTFGFDATGDRPARLAAFSATHRLAEIPAWHLASAESATTAALLDELGFSYTAIAGGFDHVTQTTILDGDGRVYRQIYGDDFPLPMLIEPLKALIFGTSVQSAAPAALWDRLRFICTVYDPAARAYRFDYGIFFGITFGALSLGLMAFIIIRLWLERRRSLRGAGRLETRVG
jgi:protein SCO1/2